MMQNPVVTGWRNKAKKPTPTDLSHAGLWLDKYIRHIDRKKEDGILYLQPEKSEKLENSQEPGASKEFLVEIAIELVDRSHASYKPFYARWKETLTALKAECYLAETKTRMIVGLGTESVLETSISLHHTYGVPYIPGSALKGLAAHYAAQAVEGLEYGSEHHNILFGDTTQAGLVTFFDALPIPEKYQLHQDVLTPHHSNYYVNATPTAPADWDSPIPVPMLAASGSFLIAIACQDTEGKDKGWTALALEILKSALENYGVGAKTSSGYGRLVPESAQ